MFKKIVANIVFVIIAVCMPHGNVTAGKTEPNCSVANDTDYTAKITLVMTPGNSSYSIDIGPHNSYTISLGPYYCARRLTGKLTYGILEKDIIDRCTGNNVEGPGGSCPEDCRTSRWKIQINGVVPHFIEQ